MLSVSLAGTMLEGLTSSGIMQMVSQANRVIENWNIEIFGNVGTSGDLGLLWDGPHVHVQYKRLNP